MTTYWGVAQSNYGLSTVRRRSDGRWEWLAPPSRGRKSLCAKSRKEVLAKARKWIAAKPEAPKAQVEDRSFGEVIEVVLSAPEDRLRVATLAQYQSLLWTHVRPRYGQIPVTRLSLAHIETLYADLAPVTSRTRVVHVHRSPQTQWRQMSISWQRDPSRCAGVL